MNQEEAYRKLIDQMKSDIPEMEGKESLIDSVMDRITRIQKEPGDPMRFLEVLFGWIHVWWLRRIMALAAIALVVFFVGQQVRLMQRLDNLERQIITSVESETISEEGPGMKQQFLMKMIMDRPAFGDSITISLEEFDALLRTYISEQLNNVPDYSLIMDPPSFRNFIEKNRNPQPGKTEQKSNL